MVLRFGRGKACAGQLSDKFLHFKTTHSQISQDAGQHSISTLLWPKCHKRKGRADVVCVKCKRFARSVKKLAAAPCTAITQGTLGFGRRKLLLKDLRKRAAKATGETKTAYTSLVDLLDTACPQAGAAAGQ